MTDKLVLGFADAAARVVSRSGGKGASLALMTQAGFPVPEGVVVSSECYRRFVEDWPDFEALVAALPVDSGHDPEGPEGSLLDAEDGDAGSSVPE